MRTEITQQVLTGERALFNVKDVLVDSCNFEDGESPLKECENIEVRDCGFRWKYPLWYCNQVVVENSVLYDTARAGIWYSHNVIIQNSMIEAPKTFRRCNQLTIKDVSIVEAQETLWNCNEVVLDHVLVKGPYFAMQSENIEAKNLTIYGDYSFDGAHNVTIHDSKIVSKDAFWNSENVTVYDSYISGEYLGWNAKNLTLVNCTIESLQGLCYIDNLVMKNCKTINTTLALEYSTVDVEITNHIDSIKNPISGRIYAKSIGELIHQEEYVDVNKTEIISEG